jgi:hypothetical protein
VTRLRQGVIGAGVVALAVVAWAWLSGARGPGLAILAVYAVMALVLLAVERFRYKPILDQPPGPPWEETPERFVDPESGKLVVVWANPENGQRAYVAAAR